MRDAKFPYGKQNLVDYRHIALWVSGAFVLCVGIGLLYRKDLGWAFAALMALAVAELAQKFFSWHPEPTAKRQIATAMVVFTVAAAAGFYLVGPSIRACLSLPIFAG